MSPFGHINFGDLGKGLLIAFGTVFLGGIYTGLQNNLFPTGPQIGALALGGLAAAVSYLLKNLFTNSDNKAFTPEPPVTQ